MANLQIGGHHRYGGVNRDPVPGEQDDALRRVTDSVAHRAASAVKLLHHAPLSSVEAIVGGNLQITVEGVFVKGVKLTNVQLAELLPRLQSMP